MGAAERVVATRADLAKARDDAQVALRGWYFPHVDRERVGNFAEGIQSATTWEVHHEAHRAFVSGLFLWRGLVREDFESGFAKTLMYESTIWSFVEICLFASRFLSAILESGNVVVDAAIHGLAGRRLVASRPSVSLWGDRFTEEEDFRQQVAMPLGELRVAHLLLPRSSGGENGRVSPAHGGMKR